MVKTKSYEVKAVQWDGNIRTCQQISDMTGNAYHIMPEGDIMLRQGTVFRGDWVINDHGTILICPKEMFDELYEVTE